ncbi:hypothetical protein MKW92_000812 [Papaver armeniacum]|nr:hypothetical protein MKW92_000812 [Papaver armeniacum]
MSSSLPEPLHLRETFEEPTIFAPIPLPWFPKHSDATNMEEKREKEQRLHQETIEYQVYLRKTYPKATFLFPIAVAVRSTPENSDMTNMEEEKEEWRRRCQVKFFHKLNRETAQRLLGENQAETAYGSGGLCKALAGRKMTRDLVRMQESRNPNHWVLQLPDVILIHTKMGETFFGCLEARECGFMFFTPSGFQLCFKDTSVRLWFLRHGGDMMRPLLQFHFHHPIMVGIEETMDIQFHLVPTSVRRESSDTYASGDRGKDLADFVRRIGMVRWDSQRWFPRVEHLNECELYGVLPSYDKELTTFPVGASAVFSLTFQALLLLVAIPFIVIPLKDIEIVNLAKLESGEIDMTVVFKDFKRDVLQINSIPFESLTQMKHVLNLGLVKYYCNSKKLDWDSILKDILKHPKRFVDSGGWRSYDLEDECTLSYYDEIAEPVEKEVFH